jgi:hypothetical protein
MSDTPGSEDDDRPSPGASDPGEPGYDGETTVGDDGFEGLDVDDEERPSSDPSASS